MTPQRSGPARLRLRRRLLLWSAPVIAVLLVTVAKMASVVVVGDSAVSHFAERDVDALSGDVSTLNVLNVIEPAKARFAAGDLAVLNGRLEEADEAFSEVLSGADPTQSCPTRINLELVRETRGDVAAREGNADLAAQRYTSALTLVGEAPAGCFEGNSDPDPDRRTIRNDAATRLADKIAALNAAPPPAAPEDPVAPPPPPPPPLRAGSAPEPPPSELRLNPDEGNPIDRLQQILGDAAVVADNRE